MSPIEAIYRHGIFEPLQPVSNLDDEQRVLLSIECTESNNAEAWLQRVRNLHASIISRHGLLPDSTPDIAADRMR